MVSTVFSIEYNPDDKINQLAMTMAILKHSYITDLHQDVIAEKAIKGLLNELDPHSDYLDINKLSDLEDTTAGKVVGIGVEVTSEHGLLKIIAPLSGSPAEVAGIQNGDYITHVNDQLVIDIGIAEAISRIKGQPGTTVKITVARTGNKTPLVFNIVRKEITAPSVKSSMLTDSIGYVKISYFGIPTKEETENSIKSLMRKNPNISGIVIDLRNNPGGILDAAVEITDLFLDKDTIGYDRLITIAKERDLKVTQAYRAQTKDITNNLPLAIVINSGSASASEIMASALKDHKRAVIVGETSFGKGSIQSVLPLSDHSAIKITTGLYYSPSGHIVQKNGVLPDVYSEPLIPAGKDPLDFRESEYLNSITSSRSKQGDHNTSHLQMSIVRQYGFEVYQAIQTLQNQSQEIKCP